MTLAFYSFAAFGTLSKERLLFLDSLKWAPMGLLDWVLEHDQDPGMVNFRENRTYAHELARKLIKDKREELKNGTSRKDVLSLLSSSSVPFENLGVRCNIQLFSQGKFRLTARLAAER